MTYGFATIRERERWRFCPDCFGHGRLFRWLILIASSQATLTCSSWCVHHCYPARAVLAHPYQRPVHRSSQCCPTGVLVGQRYRKWNKRRMGPKLRMTCVTIYWWFLGASLGITTSYSEPHGFAQTLGRSPNTLNHNPCDSQESSFFFKRVANGLCR